MLDEPGVTVTVGVALPTVTGVEVLLVAGL